MPLRFAIDCTMYRPGVAGIGSYMLNLCEGFAESANEDEVTVFVLASQVATFARFAPALRVQPVRARNVVQRILWQNLVLPWRARRFDAVLFPTSFTSAWLSRPSVVVVQDVQYLTYPHYFSAPRRLYRYVFTGRSLRTARVVVAPSAFTAAELHEHFGVSARVVLNPVAHREVSREASRPDEPPYFLVPGNLAPHKNLAALAQALREWPAAEPLPRVVFIGPYQAKDFPFALPPERVEFRGFVPFAERDRLLRDAVAVVIPSVYEGFGMPYVEATLAGTPVIASDIPPARELLGDRALYIPAPYGAAEITATLRRAAGGVPAMSDAERETLRERTSPVNVGRQMRAALHDAVSGAR